MTAEQPSPSHLFPISTLTTTHGDNKVDLIHETKKRKRLLLEEEEELNTSLSPPIEKSPRRDDYQGIFIYTIFYVTWKLTTIF